MYKKLYRRSILLFCWTGSPRSICSAYFNVPCQSDTTETKVSNCVWRLESMFCFPVWRIRISFSSSSASDTCLVWNLGFETNKALRLLMAVCILLLARMSLLRWIVSPFYDLAQYLSAIFSWWSDTGGSPAFTNRLIELALSDPSVALHQSVLVTCRSQYHRPDIHNRVVI